MTYTQKELNEKLVSAGYRNDIDLIKELLTSPKLEIHAQINADSSFIANVCSNGDLNTLKYILTSPELKEHADVHLSNEIALSCAIYVGDIPMVKYLLTSPELKEHSDLHNAAGSNKDIVFEYIFKMRSFDTSSKLIDYLTLEYSIEKKDAEVYRKLMEYADDNDFENQIKNNLLANIVNEKDENYQKSLVEVLCDFDLEAYKSFMSKIKLQESLKSDLPTSKHNSTNKTKI